ncbi:MULTISPECIES: hypothetical protein [Pectobacterium]|uniref:hypothetical protein n=1 Tax=Pectobacterium TaxID=122277 RepID=UPI00057F6257|nr:MULTISPECIES: hypothetical protein [Pectobacterium]KHT23492.1 hypothetical protein RC96_03480 [Pectobacterium carotovorum subsp. carotovorum]MCH4996856.1 hypothetical protein [Pectobacterium carotovorum]WDG01023.1 hypothetical protein PSR30_10950 [Pectobacterium carotovorum subsp. carotovorum]GKW37362.1 outer membrane protein [Pectobacterium carotovorum subsp. carotovorum]
MRKTSISMFMLAFFSFAAEAATDITIDSQRNCLSAPFTDTLTGTPVKFNLDQGRYVVSLVSNTMNCMGASNSCIIDSVMLQGGFKNARWGVSVTSSPTVVDTTTSQFVAYIVDNNCNDNAGKATLLIQKAE